MSVLGLTLLFYSFISNLDRGIALTKVWTPNTNYANPSNWDVRRIPCAKDKVIFPKDVALSVFIDSNIAFKELYLPYNGELILSSVGELNTEVNEENSCEGEDVHFEGTEVKHWYNPLNWKVHDSWGNLIDGRRRPDPVPHAERLPCAHDDVIFPANSSFKVRLEGFHATVKTFNINGKLLDSNQLTSFLGSTSGRSQFQMDSSLSVNKNTCVDKSGCVCDNTESRKLNHICKHLTDQCPTLACADPVYPEGSCCPLCGAMMTFTFKRGFELAKLKDYIGSFLKNTKFNGIAAFISKTNSGKIQAVFADDAPHESINLVQFLHSELTGDIKMLSLKLLSTKLAYSERWIDGSTSPKGLSAGGVAALVIGLMTLTVILLLFYMQRHRFMPLSFSFSFGRFENDTDDRYMSQETLELGADILQQFGQITQSKTESVVKVDTSGGIDNPFYDPSLKEPDVSPDATKAIDNGENPCYMAFERVEDIPSIPEGENVKDKETTGNEEKQQ